MDRDQISAALRAHESDLKRAGILRLSLFGSTARGDQHPDSDVDLLVLFDETIPLSLLDVLHIENRIAALLGHSVDLVEERTLKPRVQKSAEAEAVCVF
jgi:predicted nucleotidyltransferase